MEHKMSNEEQHKKRILYIITKSSPDVSVGTPTEASGLE